MADALLNGGGDEDIFVYTGGRAPHDVRRAKIDESIDTIPARAFYYCRQLIEVVGHDKLKKIEGYAFYECRSLRRLIKMSGVIEIEQYHVFSFCEALSVLEFDKLEIIGYSSLSHCKSLRSIKIESARRIGGCAFHFCTALTDAVFGEDLEWIDACAFNGCRSLRCIVIPLKDYL